MMIDEGREDDHALDDRQIVALNGEDGGSAEPG